MDTFAISKPLEVLLPQGMILHVIGKEGRNIIRMRDKSGAHMKVGTRPGDEGESIDYVIISGSQEQILRARALVLATVTRQHAFERDKECANVRQLKALDRRRDLARQKAQDKKTRRKCMLPPE